MISAQDKPPFRKCTKHLPLITKPYFSIFFTLLSTVQNIGEEFKWLVVQFVPGGAATRGPEKGAML